MKKFILALLICVLITTSLVVIVILLLSKYHNEIEKHAGVLPVSSSEATSIASYTLPPVSFITTSLDVYSPMRGDVYTSSKIKVNGKARSSYVIVTLNKGIDRILKTNTEGKFLTELELAEGVNQITILANDRDSQLIQEDFIVGYYPDYTKKNAVALLGEIKNIYKEDSSIQISTQTEELDIPIKDNTYIINKTSTVEKKLHYQDLDVTQRIGVLVQRDIEQGFITDSVEHDYFPNNFDAVVIRNSDSELIVERSSASKAQEKIKINSNTYLYKVQTNLTTEKIQTADIRVGDKVYINAFTFPKENRSIFTANRILLLTQNQ